MKVCKRRHVAVPVFVLLVLALTASALASDPPAAYRLGPGDVLQISVWGQEQLNQLVEVRPDGQVAFPLAGEVAASGLTPAELRETLASRLGTYLREPQVTVSIKEFRTITVQVAGQVRNPGLYRLRPGARLAEAIAAAGGVTEGADLARATLVTGAAGQVSLDLETLFARGEQAANLEVTDQALLVLPEVRRVTVLGEVKSPGVVPVRRGDGYPELLARAGGATPEADLSRAYLVRSTGERLPVDLEALLLKGAPANAPQFDDRSQLVIPQLRKATVLGEVKSPGLVPVKKGDGYAEVLARAGGATADADLTRVEAAAFPASGPAAPPALLDLTSPEPGRLVTLPEGGRLVVTVPKRLRRVTVLGQVLHPGTYPVDEKANLLDVLGAAGGPTDRALLDSVRVYRGGSVDHPEAVVMGREDLLFEGSLQTGPSLRPGDVVFVPETKRVNWDKVLQLLTGLTLIKDLLE